ncbi:sigma factor-like helix-turn-helix DNA-binding protein [Hankyongella ginsenosidimutans]|uniref:sigma factor-like helix-turn-helix DNA-binding protein n=1 Tax=Hankyongella ginsenosidimutans TaxID=1763828 RepID=UPI002482E536|nr:sigma factor-like helix-turn-helix DNA-binding protein [Hankyongella ginsenosidimutans]
MHAALLDVPARQRAALALFYVDGLSMAEVAHAMETQPKAVESLLSRGRAHLKALLTPLKEAL